MRIAALVLLLFALPRLDAATPEDLTGALTALTFDHKTQYVDTQIDGYFFQTEPAGELAVFVIRGYAPDPPKIKAVYLSRTWENKESTVLPKDSPAQGKLLGLLKNARVAAGAEDGDLQALVRDLGKERE